MYRVEFIEADKLLPKNVESIVLGTKSGRYRDVLVFQNDKAVFHLSCFGKFDEAEFTQETIIWLNWIVVGFGEQIYLFETKKRQSKVLDLGFYFSKLHTTDNLLFAVSGEHIHALSPSGELVWKSELLGIDGVVLHEIGETFLLGEGEFDPPGGWKPFRISLDKGLVEWL